MAAGLRAGHILLEPSTEDPEIRKAILWVVVSGDPTGFRLKSAPFGEVLHHHIRGDKVPEGWRFIRVEDLSELLDSHARVPDGDPDCGVCRVMDPPAPPPKTKS